MLILKPKSWTLHQQNRLPIDGYWYENNIYPIPANINGITVKNEVNVYCVKQGRVKYYRPFYHRSETPVDQMWNTLIWSCCPTKKQITTPKPDVTYVYYSDYQQLMLAHPELLPLPKAPNDF